MDTRSSGHRHPYSGPTSGGPVGRIRPHLYSVRPIADGGAPIRDEKGEVTGVVLVFRDQTEERAAQRALAESAAKHRNLMENASIGIFCTKIDASAVLDAKSKLCEMLGLTREEFVGHPSAIAWANPERRAELVLLLRQKGHCYRLSGRGTDS
jgi:PAS domain-containing protein